MTKKQFAVLAVLTVVAAFFGGMVAGGLPRGALAAVDDGMRKMDSLEVRVLKVVDESGKTRAWLGMEEGDPLFVMQSGSGEPRMALGAHDTGASMSLIGDEEKTGIAIFDPKDKRVVWKAPDSLSVPSDK